MDSAFRAIGKPVGNYLASFFSQVKSFTNSSLRALPTVTTVEIHPNLVVRAVLAHLLSANDKGYPGRFDNAVRSIFREETHLRNCPLYVFYWRYNGKWLTIARDLFVTETLGAGLDPDWLNVLKLKPIGFAVTDKPKFRNLPCLNNFITQHDSQVAKLPFALDPIDLSAHWPATTGERGIMLTGGTTSGLVAEPMWRRR